MTPAAWIALAYGLVGGAILLYIWRLRRRIHQAEREAPAQGAGQASRARPR